MSDNYKNIIIEKLKQKNNLLLEEYEQLEKKSNESNHYFKKCKNKKTKDLIIEYEKIETINYDLKNNPQNLVLGWTTVLETTNYTETALLYYNSAGIKGGNATMQWDTNVTTSLSFSTDYIIGFALDLTSNELKVYKNNSLVSTITLPTDKGDTWIPCCGDSSGTDGSAVLNFGQRAFSYTPPTGFRSVGD